MKKQSTDPMAIFAIKMIQNDLVDSYNGDMTKRASMHNAQCLAGIAFSNALLGIVHSMAHKTGAVFEDLGAHIIHGAANAMYLPKVIAFNAKNAVADACTGSNPRAINPEQMEKLLKCCYYDTEVDF